LTAVTVTLAAVGAAMLVGSIVWYVALRPLEQMKERLAEERSQFEALAHEDSLTGIPNKRAFLDRLDAELRRAAREYYPVSIVVLDLDRFKQINDSWGHAVGDDALVKLSRHIQAELRAGDICGRLGGDEFSLALVRADAQAAEVVLARLRNALASVMIGPAQEQLSFSAGIAEFPRHGSDRDVLLQCADTALYWGKANGRDRTSIFTPEPRDAMSPQRSDEAIRRRSLLTTLQQLSKAVDSKNRFTGGHSERVATFAVALAKSLDMPDDKVSAIRQAALLHDVGKIGIAESILLKEQPLNLEEIDELKRHSELGRAMLAGAGMPELGRWVNHLHERFDGQGYPSGLAGREIPVESRILGAADTLDLMTRPREYRRHRPLKEALAELSFAAGTRLDPELAARLVDLVESGELKVPGHEVRPHGGRRAIERPRTRPAC
jgi:diguanylate cyclase (GGDEF)-like protein